MPQIHTCLLIVFFLLFPILSSAQEGPFGPGDRLPAFSMTAPESAAHRDYLGLSPETSTFTLTDVDAPLVLIQIFSMYCPICQREASEVNTLHALIEEQGLADRIKILGLGAGNSDLEVQVFRERYAVPFPLISDPDYILHQVFQGIGTPYFVLAQSSDVPETGHIVRFSHLGAFDSAQGFLEQMLRTQQ